MFFFFFLEEGCLCHQILTVSEISTVMLVNGKPFLLALFYLRCMAMTVILLVIVEPSLTSLPIRFAFLKPFFFLSRVEKISQGDKVGFWGEKDFLVKDLAAWECIANTQTAISPAVCETPHMVSTHLIVAAGMRSPHCI